MFSIKIW